MQSPRKNPQLNEYTLEDESPSTVSASRVKTPAIVVLLGSTSAISALELMRHMLTLKPSDRRRVAFIYIDTDTPPNDLIKFRRDHNGVFQEFPLRIAVPAGISHVERIPQQLSSGEKLRVRKNRKLLPNPANEPHTFIEGKEPQYFESGAGGIRNNGHVAACFNYQRIYDTLDRALAAVMRVDDVQGVERKKEVEVHIVAFLGGGTGSGILSDIAIMARDLLTNYQYKQRINLFCMLPEPIRGASLTDLGWRKSNATACLLETLAYSVAAAAEPSGKYIKYMRDKKHTLTYGPIANEVFLIGHAAMDDSTNTARIVGLDVFQRITDASGVGYLEHSKAVDRRTLEDTDDRGLPTMFGTSCPLEVRFPAEETATAFARLAATQVLPLLASHHPDAPRISDADKAEWTRKWKNVARLDANARDPGVIAIPTFRKIDFEEADQSRLDLFWSRLQRYEDETELKIKQVIAVQHKNEMQRIHNVPQQAANSSAIISLIDLRLQHLQRLQQEYTFALDLLTTRSIPRVPPRQVQLEAELAQPANFLGILINMGHDYAYEVCDAYNQRMVLQAAATRYRLLEQLLKELLQSVQESSDVSLKWFEGTEVEERAQELETQGLSSMAWRGRLEYSHPHQRHIFDLSTLRTNDGRNLAVERLYAWATGNDRTLLDGTPIDYRSFVGRCLAYLARNTTKGRGSTQSGSGIEEYSAGRLGERVVDFFKEVYMEKFQNTNLFELLNVAAPPSQRGQRRNKQTSEYLLEHLQHMRGLVSGLITFEAELWPEGVSTLDTSVYLGMHVRDGYQQAILDQALADLGPIASRGQAPMFLNANDPHRLQVSYGQHAISLSTIRDFYLDQNSAMDMYQNYQKKWEPDSHGTHGLMPTHSCSEAQLLVRDSDILGYNQPLYMRVMRRTHSQAPSHGPANVVSSPFHQVGSGRVPDDVDEDDLLGGN